MTCITSGLLFDKKKKKNNNKPITDNIIVPILVYTLISYWYRLSPNNEQHFAYL